jgi:hypothetical protein
MLSLLFFAFSQAELGKPSLLHPDKGKVSIFVNCSATAAPIYEVTFLYRIMDILYVLGLKI